MSFTVTVMSTSCLSDEYVDVETPHMEVDELPITIDNSRIEPLEHFDTAALELEEIVLGDTITVKVPCLTWTPPSRTTSGSTLSICSTSTAPTSPTSVKQESPITWSNSDLLYLTSILKPQETSSNTLVFTPPLSDLDNTSNTYPIHLQLYTKTPLCIPPVFTSNPYSKHAPIGTGRPSHRTTFLAESSKACSTPSAARRSLAQALLSDPRVVSAELDRCNVLYTFHSTPLPILESILRGMHLMARISDAEWLGRLAQLRGTVDSLGVVVVGECVDTTCGVEARIEYFLLEMGRLALDDWMRCLGVCLEVREEGERSICRDVYGDAARFLVRAYREVVGCGGGYVKE